MRRLLLALVVPLALFAPMLVAGRVFLPYLPTVHEPLASENPAAAAAGARGAHWVTGDRILPFLTDQIAIGEDLRAGHLPTWEPRLGLGVPLFAGSLAAPLYPPNWLSFVVAPERAAAILALLQLALAGLGMGLFLGRRGLSFGACLVGVVGVQVGGWGIANLHYFMKVDAALWLPWSLWAVEGIARRARWSATALAFSTALSFLAGFVPIAIFVLAATGVYAALRLGPVRQAGDEERPPVVRGLFVFALAVVLGLGISAAQLLPTAMVSRDSARTAGGDPATQALPTSVALGTLVPDLFGAPTETTAAGHLPVAWWLTPPDQHYKAEIANQLEWNTYAGTLAVLLAITALVARPRRALLPAGLLLGAFGFAVGWPVVRLAYHLPGLALGAPGRVLALAWILWPWLDALGCQALCEHAPRAFRTFLAASFVLAAVLLVAWVGFDAQMWASDLETTLLTRYGERFDQTIATIRERIPPASAVAAGLRLHAGLAHALGGAMAALAAGAIALVLGRLGPRFESRSPALLVAGSGVVVIALAGAPLWSHGGVGSALFVTILVGAALVGLSWRPGERTGAGVWAPILFALGAEGLFVAEGSVSGRQLEGPVFPPSPTVERVREAAGDGRVVRYDASPSGVDDVVALARPNLLLPYGIADLNAWVVFTPRSLFELFQALDPRALFRRQIANVPDPALLSHPLLDLLRVEAVLSRAPLEHPRLEPVLERPGFCVYHRTGALPLARIVPRALAAASDAAAIETLVHGAVDFDQVTLIAPDHAADLDERAPRGDWKPGAIERVERPSPGRLAFEIWGSSGGWLVMHEQYAEGWHARVNGEEVPLVRADQVCRAVRIPRGDSRVETWYAPAELTIGAWISLGALAAALWMGARTGRRAARGA